MRSYLSWLQKKRHPMNSTKGVALLPPVPVKSRWHEVLQCKAWENKEVRIMASLIEKATTMASETERDAILTQKSLLQHVDALIEHLQQLRPLIDSGDAPEVLDVASRADTIESLYQECCHQWSWQQALLDLLRGEEEREEEMERIEDTGMTNSQLMEVKIMSAESDCILFAWLDADGEVRWQIIPPVEEQVAAKCYIRLEDGKIAEFIYVHQ